MSGINVQCWGPNVPKRGSSYAAGWDICASAEVVVAAGQVAKVPTGLHLIIPSSHYGQLMSRSGLAAKNNVTVEGGVIDSDYRGEIMVILRNGGGEPYTVKEGDRVAQLLFIRVPAVAFDEVTEKQFAALSTAESGSGSGTSANTRGSAGFGSTGK